MGKAFDHISDAHASWLAQQHILFVATATAAGHVNVSPKGYVQGSFRVLSPRKVAFLDCTGSGSETAAHLYSDGRITIMFVAFDGAPQIVRLYGTASVLRRGSVPDDLRKCFDQKYAEHKGFRSVIVVDVERVSQSYGYSIPMYEFKEDRQRLYDHFEGMTDEQVNKYHVLKNCFSIDALPSIAHRAHCADAPRVRREWADGYWFARPGYSMVELRSDLARLLFGPVAAQAPLQTALRHLVTAGLGAAVAALILRRQELLALK
mmetsp:Transcript_121062/g.387550  ORF Transcript_121062/g.387550 Transcript_121062/m.387550 type:complete len:263 (-) Transcript_121062:591-1379(-)